MHIACIVELYHLDQHGVGTIVDGAFVPPPGPQCPGRRALRKSRRKLDSHSWGNGSCPRKTSGRDAVAAANHKMATRVGSYVGIGPWFGYVQRRLKFFMCQNLGSSVRHPSPISCGGSSIAIGVRSDCSVLTPELPGILALYTCCLPKSISMALIAAGIAYMHDSTSLSFKGR